jgi:hypothetical protein
MLQDAHQSIIRSFRLANRAIHPSTLALSWPRYHYEEKVGVYDAVEQVLVVQQLAINMFAFIFLVLLSGRLENNHILSSFQNIRCFSFVKQMYLDIF